jgi:hypothetical protein
MLTREGAKATRSSPPPKKMNTPDSRPPQAGGTVIYPKFGKRSPAKPSPPPPPKAQVNQAKYKAEKAVAVFAEEYDKLRKLIGAEAGIKASPDLANSAMQRVFLNVLLNAIPVAEKAYLGSGGVNSAYALSTLINNAREIGRDIIAKNSLEHQVNHVMMEIVAPALKLILHQQVLNITNLRSAIDNSSKNSMREAFNKSLEGTAQTLTDTRERLDAQLRKYLLSPS